MTSMISENIVTPENVMIPENARIAVLLPCYNEEISIKQVIDDFKKVLPTATIYVYDNNSSDKTTAIAQASGAVVRTENRQGKGNVVRRMFADIDADIYVMADGDDTYDAAAAPKMIERLMSQGVDMVVGIRRETHEEAYRRFHRIGNAFFNSIIGVFFGNQFSDIFSGYRVFSRRFVKSFPSITSGFEIETEMSVHALQLSIPTEEMITDYKEREEGSLSKLKTYRDGFRILRFVLLFLKEIRPFLFFGALALLLSLVSVGVFYPVFIEYLQTGLVPRFPTAMFSMGIMIIAIVSFFTGLILDSVSRGRLEKKRLFFLSFPSVMSLFDRK